MSCLNLDDDWAQFCTETENQQGDEIAGKRRKVSGKEATATASHALGTASHAHGSATASHALGPSTATASLLPSTATASLAHAHALAPTATPLYISTKTKICYLNQVINLADVFWKITLTPYHLPTVGVVKKQMKFNSLNPEQLAAVLLEKDKYENVDEFIITQLNNPGGRVPFKDIRKLSFGLCRKDITSYRAKKRSAFYNCFVVILRLLYGDVYKEIHVKVFNTGKLEIPGIQDDGILHTALNLLTDILKPLISNSTVDLRCVEDKSETVLINSNFNCGYYIDRETFHEILKYKYKINSNYDPCSYPGIQCEFYYDPAVLSSQHGMQPPLAQKVDTEALVTKVSFMVFRTGSVLIVGKCTEEILYDIYRYLSKIFVTEFAAISVKTAAQPVVKKSRKIRKKTITL
jgi:hypothetical protein